MRGLKDKVTIVTGAAQGIGEAIAHRLGEEGCKLILADINAEGVKATADAVRAAGGIAEGYGLNVAERESWVEVIEAAVERFGRLDALVNNAGVTRDKSLLKMSDADWDLVIDVNLKGSWIGSQLAVAKMVGQGGSIVNFSSESRWGAFGQSNYAAAKSGLVGLTRTVAIEAARHGVRVNAIAPGTILTPMVEAVPAEVRAGWMDKIPLRREGQPSEIASAVAFLLSEDASYVTGQILGVNGGSCI